MRRDFTLQAFDELLRAFLDAGYRVIPFRDYVGKPEPGKIVILRHDVDRRPSYAVRLAELESRYEVAGTYYFRSVPESFSARAMTHIASLGHEIGYHYEDVALENGDLDRAVDSFDRHLRTFRQLIPVETICMHGSPLSRWDNRMLWTRFSYRERGLRGEPYLDTDFDTVFYATDTGRAWNRGAASIRDKVGSPFAIAIPDSFRFAHLVRSGRIPDHVMITIHPQRWTDALLPWLGELVLQTLKNQAKFALVRRRSLSK